MKRLSIIAGVLLVAGCQGSVDMANSYYQIAPGPAWDYSKARCDIMAMGTQQSIVAWGSAEYVAGAQIGNAIANEGRRMEFVKNCMTLHGWKLMSPEQQAAVRKVQQQQMAAARKAQQQAALKRAQPQQKKKVAQ